MQYHTHVKLVVCNLKDAIGFCYGYLPGRLDVVARVSQLVRMMLGTMEIRRMLKW